MEGKPSIKNILLIEPFYSGSHQILIDLLHDELKSKDAINVKLHTLPGKKWHWRARTSALHFSQAIPNEDFEVIFASCVLPFHELLGLRPEFHKAKKVIYFHENQLVYPVRKSKERDFQYGYNQILSCLSADLVIFNSNFNKESFLSNIQPYFKLQPDFRPKGLREQIEPKCQVLYFPMKFEHISNYADYSGKDVNCPIRIVWPHRWEFDKNPDLFFRVLLRLSEENYQFRLSVLGENFADNPPIFSESKLKLEKHIDHFGFLSSKEEYFEVLKGSDLVISTADHEFFGVAMLEAVSQGCYPLCPHKLVYPEIFPPSCLYSSEQQLYTKLKFFIKNPTELQKSGKDFFLNFDLFKYSWSNLRNEFMNCFYRRSQILC